MKYNQIIINTDGGSRGNPGPAAIGVSAKSSTGAVIFELSEYLGRETNNVAEYTAVIRALAYVLENKISTEKTTFILDSELIARQITGVYRVKEAHLQTLVAQVKKLIQEIKDSGIAHEFTFKNVLRVENKRADQLVNQALDSNK